MASTKLAAAIAAGFALSVAVPADAAITTFANYTAVGTGANIYWKNNPSGGGSIYTVSSAGSTTPGAVSIVFSFLNPALSPYVNNITAAFTLNATTTAAAISSSGYKIEPGIVGSFSIVTTAPITIDGHTYSAGANLLSATTFNKASVFGKNTASSGSLSSSTGSGATITYTSDFLTFTPGAQEDFSLSLTSILPTLLGGTGGGLRSFSALSTGSFSTAGMVPHLVGGVPEPASWALFIGGFGGIGAALRRRRIRTAFV